MTSTEINLIMFFISLTSLVLTSHFYYMKFIRSKPEGRKTVMGKFVICFYNFIYNFDRNVQFSLFHQWICLCIDQLLLLTPILYCMFILPPIFKTRNSQQFELAMSDIIVWQFKSLSESHFGTLQGSGKPVAIKLCPVEVQICTFCENTKWPPQVWFDL